LSFEEGAKGRNVVDISFSNTQDSSPDKVNIPKLADYIAGVLASEIGANPPAPVFPGLPVLGIEGTTAETAMSTGAAATTRAPVTFMDIETTTRRPATTTAQKDPSVQSREEQLKQAEATLAKAVDKYEKDEKSVAALRSSVNSAKQTLESTNPDIRKDTPIVMKTLFPDTKELQTMEEFAAYLIKAQAELAEKEKALEADKAKIDKGREDIATAKAIMAQTQTTVPAAMGAAAVPTTYPGQLTATPIVTVPPTTATPVYIQPPVTAPPTYPGQLTATPIYTQPPLTATPIN